MKTSKFTDSLIMSILKQASLVRLFPLFAVYMV